MGQPCPMEDQAGGGESGGPCGMMGGPPMHGGVGPWMSDALGGEGGRKIFIQHAQVGKMMDLIKSFLSITKEQEEGWNQFNEAVRAQTDRMYRIHPGMVRQFSFPVMSGKGSEKALEDLKGGLTEEQKGLLNRFIQAAGKAGEV
ncbi:MAG: hypothetical protein HQL51_14885 [Magnetococcales bacterium]|nr:hypothetical protein [Magnetococcales bacterium]